jgi:hypothetical protein
MARLAIALTSVSPGSLQIMFSVAVRRPRQAVKPGSTALVVRPRPRESKQDPGVSWAPTP